MKHAIQKGISAILASLILAAALTVLSFAADSISVFVTVSDGSGKLPVAYEKVKATDRNGDGSVTVDEVLYAAHEAEFTGGADAGYASAEGTYGTYITRLWGVENGGSYGYYRNHAACMSLDDVCEDGDLIVAFVYSDTQTYSDAYCYFETDVKKIYNGDEVTLTLNQVGFDENYNTVVSPLADAAITIDGKETEYKTDANGQVTLEADATGIFIVSATVEGKTIVPPAYQMVVNGPKTGDDAPLLTYAFIAVLSMGVVVALLTTKPKHAE